MYDYTINNNNIEINFILAVNEWAESILSSLNKCNQLDSLFRSLSTRHSSILLLHSCTKKMIF